MKQWFQGLREWLLKIPVVAPLVMSWRLVAVLSLLAGLLVFGLTLRQPDVYTAQVSILPHKQESQLGMLSQVASLTGLNLGGSASLEALYAKILESDLMLDGLLQQRWTVPGSSDPVGVAEVVAAPGFDASRPSQVQSLKRTLRLQTIHFSRDRISGYMALKVTLPESPELAAHVANYLVESLAHFIREFFIAKAREQREFLETRLDVVQAELQVAEDALTDFALKNRSYQSSPHLLQEFNELQREVTAQTTIWVNVRQQLELARIEENKNLESLSVLDRATPPASPSGPQRLRYTLLGMILGFCVAAFIVLVRERSSLYS